MLKREGRHFLKAGLQRVVVGVFADYPLGRVNDYFLDEAGYVVIVIIYGVSVKAAALGNIADADLIYGLSFRSSKKLLLMAAFVRSLFAL